MNAYYVYMMTNEGRTVLYTGVTNSLLRRVTQHRSGKTPGFTSRYNANRLVFFERFDDPRTAISREKQIKGWRRQKKNDAVCAVNPRWEDLGVKILGLPPVKSMAWK